MRMCVVPHCRVRLAVCFRRWVVRKCLAVREGWICMDYMVLLVHVWYAVHAVAHHRGA